MAVEAAGVPAVVNTCEGFRRQAGEIASMGGQPWLPVVYYPGHIDTYSLEQRKIYISELVGPGNDNALTTQIEAAAAAGVAEAPETTVVFKGTFEEVLDSYREKMWSDGLPIIPPTKEKIEEFLKYTDYPADAVLTRVLEPSYRQATPWSVAVNGVMAGCRPEYMPVLIGIAKCLAEPNFRCQDSSSTPGWEPLIFLNGPIIKQLGFNYGAGVLNAGWQANTSVGRFWKLFQRNVLNIRVEITDKGTFGQNWNMVVAEDEDFCGYLGWNPLHVQRGFKPDDNVVTMQSNVSSSIPSYSVGATAEEHLSVLARWWARCQGDWWVLGMKYQSWWPMIVMAPFIAEVIAKGGYSKEDVLQYFYDNCKTRAKDTTDPYGTENEYDFSKACKEGQFRAGVPVPEVYCESEDPDRLIPIFVKDQLGLVVSGDAARNQSRLCYQNHGQGMRTSMKIELPKNWDALYNDSQLKKDLERNKALGFEFL